jgi:hypothetical protein
MVGAGRSAWQIKYVKIPQNRGCGFVQYQQRSSAEAAIVRMHGAEINGCKVCSNHRYEFLSGTPA